MQPLCTTPVWNRPSARGSLHQRPDFHTAAGLAEQCDVFRVAAEVCDIFVNPLQSCDHIGVAGVAGILIFLAERGKIEIAEDIEDGG